LFFLGSVEVTDGYLRTFGSSAETLVTFLMKEGYEIRDDRGLPRVEADGLGNGSRQFNALVTKANLESLLRG
jgi:hypothetical protein